MILMLVLDKHIADNIIHFIGKDDVLLCDTIVNEFLFCNENLLHDIETCGDSSFFDAIAY